MREVLIILLGLILAIALSVAWVALYIKQGWLFKPTDTKVSEPVVPLHLNCRHTIGASLEPMELKRVEPSKEFIDKYYNPIKQAQEAGQNVKHDEVNKASHYNQYSIEVIDLLDEVTIHFDGRIGSHVYLVLKYILRAPFKGTYKKDLLKAYFHMNRIIKISGWEDEAVK